MKKKIIIVTIIIIILIIAIIMLFQINKTNKDNKVQIDLAEEETQALSLLNNNNSLYTIQNIIANFTKYIREKNQNALDSILEKTQVQIENYRNFSIDKVYNKNSYMISNYYISSKNGLYLALYTDNSNSTYLIEILDAESFSQIIRGEIQRVRNESITGNEFNHFDTVNVSNGKMLEKYLKKFCQTAEKDINKAYNLLDEEYRNKKFGNIENFKNYVSNNIDKIYNATLREFSASRKADYTEYSCIDSNNYFFIIKEKSVGNYTILLDEYTIQTEEYIQQYNKFKDEEKVNQNISIFFRMLNEKEYNSAYKLLDETFKNNNFPTIDEFAEYIKNNFWDNNIANMVQIKKQEDVYVCTYSVRSGVSLSAQEKTKTFVMQLKEGTDFVMSFSVE